MLSLVVLLVACKSEFETARTLNDPPAQLLKANEYYEAGDYYEAQILYETVLPNYRGQPESQQIYYRYAKAHYEQGNYQLAAYYFNQFATYFPNSELQEDADYYTAFSYYQLSPTYRLDQGATLKAINAFQLFANAHPNSERVADANRLIDGMRTKLEKKAFETAMLYYNLGEYQAATIAFENLLKDYPETAEAERVRFLIVKGSYELARNSVVKKREERYEETLKRYRQFAQKYPNSTYLADAKSMEQVATKQLQIIRS